MSSELKKGVLTVSQLTDLIKKTIEGGFPDVQLQGEISNYKLHTSGHSYFSLKDSGAQIAAVLFRGKRKGPLKDGDHVLVTGPVTVYESRGNYQILVNTVEPMGQGALLLQLEERKKKLTAKGLFSPDRKVPLPKTPARIGIITSPTGAVIQDMLNILKRRAGNVHILLYPVRVQGEGAAQEIAEAIAFMDQHKLADVLIVGRGGGSIEDLWAFNEEIVVEAIASCATPIVSAVGHETDWTLADLAADLRAPTPSAAAELVVKEQAAQIERLQAFLRHPYFASSDALLGKRMLKLDDIMQRLDRSMQQTLMNSKLRLSKASLSLRQLDPRTRLERRKEALMKCAFALQRSLTAKLSIEQTRLQKTAAQLQGLNPQSPLKRGYALLFSEKRGSLILKASSVSAGDSIKARLADGEIAMVVR